MKLLAAGCVALLVLASGCSRTASKSEAINEGAAIPAGAPLDPLQWKVITSSVDATHATMSTLFGNDLAIASARAGKPQYAPGSVLSLVTWAQKEDQHWFGARIPKHFETMEIVKIDSKASATYQRVGAGAAGDDDVRKAYILGERASVMP
jgi:hypothetical protein